MTGTLILSLVVILTSLYKNGSNVYRSIINRDYDRLKGAALFLSLTIAVSIWQVWFITQNWL
ncbi:hypothetical protein ACFQZI_14350 [Mucilaginibacter lutimaris]|uniref:Uncharacterized protein n=1 Tax=Mucilaginibacter lutimaris TaxID=931629 RepID=A0ABW2ZII0_9SPHI